MLQKMERLDLKQPRARAGLLQGHPRCIEGSCFLLETHEKAEVGMRIDLK